MRPGGQTPAQPAAASQVSLGGIVADPQAFLETCKAIATLHERPMTDELSKIKAPTLAIVGENDQTAGVGGTVKLSRAIENAKLVILKDTGHGVYRQNPAAFRKEFDELVAGLA